MRGVVALNGSCVVKDDVEVPTLKASEVLVEVRATAVNRLDTMQRSGVAKAPPGASEVLGLEVAGVILEVGSTASDKFAIGDEVLSLVSGGGYGAKCAAEASATMKKPKNISWTQAASIPEVWLTAFQLLFVIAKVQRGDTVLIHAAASGVGCAAVQLARDAGAHVVTTASNSAKIDFTKTLGAHDGIVVPRSTESWQRETSLKFDVILDCVGAQYAADNLAVLNTDGRWVLYSLLSGGDISNSFLVDSKKPLAATFLPTLMAKRGSLLGTLLRGRSVAYKADLVDRFQQEGKLEKIQNGTFKLIVDKSFNGLRSAQAAHDYMESNVNIGKITIELDTDDHQQQCAP